MTQGGSRPLPCHLHLVILSFRAARPCYWMASPPCHPGRLWFRHLVGVDDEFLEVRRPERSSHRHVHGVPAACHKYSADARRVVPGVEREPPAIEVRLEPTA